MNRPHGPALFVLLLLLSLLAAACTTAPSQHDPARYGEVTVFVAPEWLDIDEARVVAELTNLNALGPRFVQAPTGTRSTARVIVQPFNSPSCFVDAAHWIVGTRIVEIDPTCTSSDSAFRQAVGHEIGHALGMNHVCEREGDAPDCSPVGWGDAMMGPRIRKADDSPGFTEVYSGALGFDEPTELDLAEFRRVYSVVITLPPVTGRDGGVR